jgi:hypothetical protein
MFFLSNAHNYYRESKIKWSWKVVTWRHAASRSKNREKLFDLVKNGIWASVFFYLTQIALGKCSTPGPSGLGLTSVTSTWWMGVRVRITWIRVGSRAQ